MTPPGFWIGFQGGLIGGALSGVVIGVGYYLSSYREMRIIPKIFLFALLVGIVTGLCSQLAIRWSHRE